MGFDRLQKIDTLFHAAREVESARRADFLRDACGEDHNLRREVESLLGYDEQGASFLEQPAVNLAARSLDSELPAKISHYRVTGLVGEGGMGTVYAAEQEQPRRMVALKVVRPGLASPELLRRF